MLIDWFSWLSQTSLEPSLVYEYGLAFAHNELEEDDIIDFNHEFLQSMGISIAKHRLEILKLVRKEKGVSHRRPISRLLMMIKKAQKRIAKFVCALAHCHSSTIIMVPRKAYKRRWRGAMLKRNKRPVVVKQRRLMITDGGAIVGPMVKSCEGPMVYDLRNKHDGDDDATRDIHGDNKDDEEVGWSNRSEEIRWASLFQNLKPT